MNLNILLEKSMNNSLSLENIQALANEEQPGGGGSGTCSASANCYAFDAGGNRFLLGTVNCNGSGSCESGIGYVVCDGKMSKCVTNV